MKEWIRQVYQIHTYHQEHQHPQSHFQSPFPYPYPPTSPPAPAPAPAHHTDPVSGWFSQSDSLTYVHRYAYS
jgi:hypothetical protein